MRELSKKGSAFYRFGCGGCGEAARLAAGGCSRRTSRSRSFCSSRVIVVTEDIAERVAGVSSRRSAENPCDEEVRLVVGLEDEEEGSCWVMHGNPISADSRLPKLQVFELSSTKSLRL